ncbi:M28 family peptidase [Agilicoccus flavus]|uniref:M28 family peptidase n=1 Tax=Agilicoccus flavus TaxID=2775968 RepID=UPI001CF6F70E|nr:M28 family peptidase [Agilicoccus flavus]
MRTSRRNALVALAVTGLVSSGSAVAVANPSVAQAPGVVAAPPAKDLKATEKLRKAVTADAVMSHLRRFQAIADANDGNRGAGTSGYEASGKYVEGVLAKAGYTTKRQHFDFFYEKVTATSLGVVSPQARAIEHNPMSYSPATPAGGITAALVAPKVATGCDAAAWEGVAATGKIALVARGTCSFSVKSQAAKAAGASAAIIYNNADGALNGTLGELSDANVPTTGVTQAEGQALLAQVGSGPVTVKFVLDKIVEKRKTFNIIAESKRGNPDNVVMAGAHLDSVDDGPGINDNGSGSAAILEVAVQLAKQKNIQGKPANKVRFAWWGAEELGLLGSQHYVNDLKTKNPAALKKIATYLNFDMVGSPNHIIGVYDADQSTYKAPVAVPAGSTATEDVFTDYFGATKQPWVDTEFSGRSDYQAFITNGIPASGLFTGADGTKTAKEVQLFGGTAGITYDPNYHTPKDDIKNINVKALDINSDAIAHAVLSLATSTRAVNGR